MPKKRQIIALLTNLYLETAISAFRCACSAKSINISSCLVDKSLAAYASLECPTIPPKNTSEALGPESLGNVANARDTMLAPRADAAIIGGMTLTRCHPPTEAAIAARAPSIAVSIASTGPTLLSAAAIQLKF